MTKEDENVKSKVTKVQKCVYCKEEFTSEHLDDESTHIIKRGSLRFHASCFTQYQSSPEESRPSIKTRQRKCPECKLSLSPLDTDAIDVGNQTYHISCHEKIKRAEENRVALLDYVSLKYNIEFPTGFMLKQISEYHNKRGYSYKAMKACLVYIIEIEKVPVLQGTGLGLIPHYYERAKQYYKKINTAQRGSENITISNVPNKIVAIREKEIKSSRHYSLDDI